MVGILVVGFIANLLVRPVDDRFHEPVDHAAAEKFDFAAGETEGSIARGGTTRVVLSWGLASALLVYGVLMTVITAARLFTS